MKNSLNKLKTKGYIASILLVVLIVFVFGLVSLLKPNVKNIKVKDVFIKSSSLNASVIDGVSEDVTSNNYDEIKYKLKINKETSDTAVIVGRLTNDESKYARFKSIKEGVVTDDGKTITVTTTKNKLNITVIVENAPYGSTVDPKFTINSEDESKSKINVDPVVITGKSVEGTISDEKGTLFEGLELKLTKNNEEIKRTYSKENGKYVFSLGDTDGYQISLAEDKYQVVRYEEETTDSNRRILNLIIKEVEPFNIEMKKTISKLDLVINGNKQTFTYEDASIVSRSVKGAKTIEGSIYYNIYIKNTGEVKGTLTVIKDALPNGLSFDESKNPGWSKEGKYLFYTPLEGMEIEAFGNKKIVLVLDIVKTNEAKTYINTINANGEDYKYVAYYLNNNLFKEEYVINSEKVNDIDPSIENFDGWYTDKNYTNKYNFDLPVTKDIILFGKIKNNKYSVSFIDVNPNNNQETVLDIIDVDEGDTVQIDLINHPDYRGYSFKCYKLYDKCYDNEEILDDVNLYTYYNVDEYRINYDLNGGILSQNNPTNYTINDEITLNNPTKEGYSFVGWTGTDLSEKTINVTIPRGSIGDREYTANFELNKSSLTVKPNGGIYEGLSTDTVYTEDFGTIKHINDSEKVGYRFRGYNHTGGGAFNNSTFTFDNDDAELTAEYEKITYDIAYENITNAERTALNNPVTYDVETETFTLNEPSSRVDDHGNPSEDFVGWDDGSGTASKNITIPKGSTGNKTYTAVWRQNGKEYEITYELNGGTLSNPNPNTYTRATNTFTLNNPSKPGYTFIGWSGTDLIGNTNQLVTIPKGSAGDRHYVANYELIEYTIEYNGLLPTEDLGNPIKYTIESDNITLVNPSRTGYNFLGWTGSNGTTPGNVTISHGSTGDREYTVNFELIEYSLTYTLNGGAYESGKTNPSKYTIESGNIKLNNPTKEGYTFIGWTGTGIDTLAKDVIIPTGSIGHRSFLANYEPIVYTITYDYGEGSLPTGVTNPDRYTIESDEITFNNPVREGYNFTNYTENGNIITSIPTGSMGNKSLLAHYEIKKFNVKYYNESILYHTDEVDWGTTTTAPVTNPTKAHNIFLYWSEDGTNSYAFDTTIVDDKNLYAVYEEVLAPEITISPELDDLTNRTWVCNNSSNADCGVTVTLTSDHNEYELYYKIGDGEAQLYTEPFKVYENTTITAFSKKSNIYSEEISSEVTNVDSIAPTINQPATGSMSFNMTVSGTAQDAGSGVKKFTLYVKEKDALLWDDTLTYETNTFDGIRDHAENYDHTFYGVTDNTEYTIKIVAEDYVGNISELEVEVVTHPYVARVVGKNGILWYTVDPDTKEFVIDDDKEFLLFDSIQAAVDYCAGVQCTIQTNPIMPVVNESVIVAENQNITIDLDGRGITSNENATFVNNGKLQIVDRNPRMNGQEHESIGFVKNTENKGIINNNILIIGDGSSEASETFIYPELDRPIIEGKTTAIEQNREFHFYDGKIKSDVLAITDNGDDVITQYSYNVIILTEDEQNVATMDRVRDPEARIRSTYYAKLNINNAADAFSSSRTGTLSTEKAKMLSKIKQAGDYGFIYDAVNNLIYSGNSSTANTTAKSYLKIDLTDYNEDQLIAFDTFADTFNSNTYGTVTVSESLNDPGTQIYRGTGNDVKSTRVHCLEKGKVHYIFFNFIKANGNIDVFEKFVISNFRILGEKEESDDIKLYNDFNYYAFEKDSNGNYSSTNTSDYSYSHSYAVFDLRGETEPINLILKTSISGRPGADYGYVYLSDNTNFQEYNNTNGRYILDSGEVSERVTAIPLTPGILNYVHFGYYHRDRIVGDNKFTINSIGFYKGYTGNNIALSTDLNHNSTDNYHFVKGYDPFYWKAQVGPNATIYGATLNETNDGFNFDGNDSVIINNGINTTTLTSETVELEFSTTVTNDSVYYMGSNKEKISIGLWSNELVVANISSNKPFRYILPSEWYDGNKHKVTVVCNEGVYDAYFDDTLMTKSTTVDSFTGGLNASTYVGARSNGYGFNGTIYSVKVYDRALSEDETLGSTTEGLIFNLDGSDPKISVESYISNNREVSNSKAHSYITLDLTNINEDKFLYVNTKISSQLNSDFGYVLINDSPDYPSDLSSASLKISGDLDNQSAILELKKNKVNYVHFIYTKDGSRNDGNDSFIIKEIKYCNTLEDAYSINSDSYSNIDSIYFEKPILNTEVDTIEILRNITLDTPIVVPQEKEVVLDLNGFTLTSNKDDYVIKNNGKMTIMDSDYNDKHNRNIEYRTEQARLFEEAKVQYQEDLTEYNEYAGLCDGCEVSEEYKFDHFMDYLDYYNVDLTNTYEYEYATDDGIKTFNTPSNGIYLIQLWGASGGNGWFSSGGDRRCDGGKGAYTSGTIELTTDDTFYIYLGEKGQYGDAGLGVKAPSFNGGGTGGYGGGDDNAGSGGGSTDIRLINGSWDDPTSLASRIMVAAGGGGGNCVNSSYRDITYRDGGALNTPSMTVAAWDTTCGVPSITQTSGNAFGKGRDSATNTQGHASGGGGGGYYGGTYCSRGDFHSGGTGGTSYISGYNGSIAIESDTSTSPRIDSYNNVCTKTSAAEDTTCSIHYSNKVFTNAVMKSGSEEIPTYDNSDVMTGNKGNGYAKITYIMSEERKNEIKASLPKTYTIKEEPLFKNYIKLIDIDTDDLDSIDMSSNPSYNNITDEDVSGAIISTINNTFLNEEYATLNFVGGNININSNNKTAIVNRGNLIVGENAIINANNSGTTAIFNESTGDILPSAGTINANGSGSIGLLNRSSDSLISDLTINTASSNVYGIKNEAISNVTFDNITVLGSGTGFREFTSGDTIIQNSNIKSTNYSVLAAGQARASKLTINSSNLNSTLYSEISPRIVTVNNSNLTSINNHSGIININNSSFSYFDNKGDSIIRDSIISNKTNAILNRAGHATAGGQVRGKMLIDNSVINYTGTATDVSLISNSDYLTLNNVTVNNVSGYKARAIYSANTGYDNYDGSLPSVYGVLQILGDTTIDSKFGTAIYNEATLVLGTIDNNPLENEYTYSYTGEGQVFTAPSDGTYKLETWGAEGGNAYDYSCYMGNCSTYFRGGLGAYASGKITLHAGDKLYIHVGGVGSSGGQIASISARYGSYNGGGYQTTRINNWANGSGGGATDISLSDEDNTWSYDNGVTMSIRSNASYEQRILVAGGGGGGANSTTSYGGFNIDPSTSRLGYAYGRGGGGYYGGTDGLGGSSYASSTLTDVVLRNGTEEMPSYYGTGNIIIGNTGAGYAKITLLSSDTVDTIKNTPSINATNYGITGPGKLHYYDGTINAKTAVEADISIVPNNYDVYNSLDSNSNEKMILVANSDSRPVSSGEEEFVCKIGNAKYTTIQNALDASNNGDTIELLVNIEQQNKIVIPTDKTITIDYKGHTVKSYSIDYLYENHGDLTLIDSDNAKNKNTFLGDKYIYNDGTLNVSKLYIDSNKYTINVIENNGIANLDNVKIEIGNHSETTKFGIYNSETGEVLITNSEFRAFGNNRLFTNYGLLTIKDTPLISNNSAPLVQNNEQGTAILDNTDLRHENAHNSFGMYLIENFGTATIKNLTDDIFTIPNYGVLTLENNTFSAGTINSEGLLIIDSGTYRNIFNVRKTGKPIDNTGDLYSFIMHDGTINTKINRAGTGITNIEGGIINVTNDVAINNSGSGVINLGIHDNSADTKDNTRPIITGKTYGIYTSNPSLKVNFYDGIVTGQKSYNVTIDSVETGYSIKREYDETNDIETKYLTNEPMFINVTQDIMYNSIDEFNNALTNNLVNDLDLIKVYRDITITNRETEITIPNGLSITFDLNGKVIDKNNKTLFINNGTLTVIDSEDSTGIIDSTLGNIFINNGTLSISSGKFTSEQASNETEVIKNNENATLNISGGTFTKYYDMIDNRLTKSGSIINNDGNATITNGRFVTNGSYVVEGPGVNYFSNAFLNNTTGILNVTGGEYDGINGNLRNGDRWNNPNASYVNLGSLIYNSGTATIKDITANQSLIGENSGTLSFDNLTMNHIVQITHNGYAWIHGSNHNVINTGTLNFDNSNFEIYNSFIENRGGDVTINNTIIDKINDGIKYSDVDTNDHLQKNSHVIRNKANSSVTIIDSEIYNRGSGEVIDNFSTITITDSTLESARNNTLKGSGNSYDIKDSIITSGRDAAINVSSSSTVKVTGNSTVTSASSIGVNINNSTAIIGEPISIDGTVSQVYPSIKGATYAVANTNGTFNFYDGKLYGKTAPINGVTNAIEDGYAIVLGVEDDYHTAILDRIPIVKNVTKSISEDVVYYDLKTAFNEASSGDTLQMVANYNNLPTDETAINNEDVTFDLNGFFIKQANSVLIENNGTLRIIDSSQNKTGMIIAVSGDMTFINNGTIIHSSGKVESQLGVLLFNNNSGATLTIKDEATVNSLKSNKLVNNDGTLNVYNGAYLHNTGGTLITNNSLLNIIDLNNDDDSDTSSTLTAPWLYSEGNGGVILYSEYNNASIITSVGSTTNIYGGIFNNGDNSSPTYSTITKNAGTMNIKYLHSYTGVIGYNSGTLNIDDSHFYNSKTGFLNSASGILNMNNTDIDITEYDGFVLDGTKDRMWLGKTSMNNVNITSKDNISYAGRAIVFRGETIVTDSTFSLYVRNDDVIMNEATTTFENVNITAGNTIGNGGKLTLNSSTITSSCEAVISSGTLIVDNESTITTTSGNAITTTGTVEVKNRSNVISNSGIGIQLNNQAKLTLGEIGGVPDRELPYVEGSTYGVYRTTQTSQFNFYDGLIVGQSGPNAIYGGLTDVESGYETEDTIITDPETSIAKHNEYLVVSATSVAVAKVGTYSFASVGSISPSMALQNAINFAIGDGSSVKSVDLISDIDLVNDQYSVTASMPVTINLNGKTINQNSSYYLDSNISLNTNSLGGNVSKFLSDVFDLSFNPKNIIIYELSDGSKLDTTQTYTLYRDGKVLSLEKEEFGKYRYQGDNDTLIPIKGRLYIDNLQKGSYRLESSDNKYIEFDIDSDGNISGNVVENTNSSNSSSAVAKSEAELILSIQTGIERHSYLLFIIPITFIIILLMIINKNKKREIN